MKKKAHQALPHLTVSALFSLFSSLLILSWTPHTQAASEDEESDLPLPQWSAQEWQNLGHASPNLGSLLPTGDTVLDTPSDVDASFLNAGPKLSESPPSLFPESGGLQLDQMGLFLPDTLLSRYASQDDSALKPTPASSLREVPEGFLQLAATDFRSQPVADPQSLFSEVPREDLLRLIGFHNKESHIPIRLLLLDRAQKLPAAFSPATVLPSAQPSLCLIVYPLGEPWRARAFVTPLIQNQVSATYLADMMDDCIKDSMQTSDANGQLDRFAVRLSTRLFWLQKLLPKEVLAAKPASSATASRTGTAKSAAPSPLHEVAASPTPVSPFSELDPAAFVTFWAFAGWGAGIIAVLAASFAGLIYWWRRTHRRPVLDTAWILPEPTTSPRLGGAFCGGAGLTLKFTDGPQ